MNSEILASLFSGLISGVVVALLTHWLTKRKQDAEIRKLDAETRKILLETNQLLEAVRYQLDQSNEQVIYDSSVDCVQNDFRGKEGQFWIKGAHSGPTGLGELIFEPGCILNVARKNREGRFEISLRRYSYNGNEEKFVPKNETVGGQRKIRIDCEAKALGGEHVLNFVIKDKDDDYWIANEEVKVNQANWRPISLYFRISPALNFWIRIDDQKLSTAPSSLQIRNIKITERLA